MGSIQPLKIGSLIFQNPLVLAPMAGVTNLPFRRICREFGCPLAFTEMISIEGLLRSNEKTKMMVAHHASEMNGLGIQLFGDDPERLADAARWVQDQTPVSVLNVNMGCPVDKVTRCNGGAALLKDVALIGRIVKAVKSVSRVPLTVKIRAGWDQTQLNYLDVLRVAEDNGADALICHPRTRAQGYSGTANWDVTAELVRHARIPILGNGDIFTPDAVRRNLAETRCAGVMIARGANGNPWIFRSLGLTSVNSFDDLSEREIPSGIGSEDKLCSDKPSSLNEVRDVILKHLEYSLEHFGSALGIRLFRKHLIWYSDWLKEGRKEFRQRVMTESSLEKTREMIRVYFRSDADLPTRAVELPPTGGERTELRSDQ